MFTEKENIWIFRSASIFEAFCFQLSVLFLFSLAIENILYFMCHLVVIPESMLHPDGIRSSNLLRPSEPLSEPVRAHVDEVTWVHIYSSWLEMLAKLFKGETSKQFLEFKNTFLKINFPTFFRGGFTAVCNSTWSFSSLRMYRTRKIKKDL